MKYLDGIDGNRGTRIASLICIAGSVVPEGFFYNDLLKVQLGK